MVGDRLSRRARAISTCGAPRALAKSWADSPILNSRPGRPRFARIFGASHGSGDGSAGQTPSFNPPRMVRSACCSRASSKPQMNTRGSAIGRTNAHSVEQLVEDWGRRRCP